MAHVDVRVYLRVTHAVRFVARSSSWWDLNPCFAGNFRFANQVEGHSILWDYIQQERRHHLPDTPKSRHNNTTEHAEVLNYIVYTVMFLLHGAQDKS